MNFSINIDDYQTFKNLVAYVLEKNPKQKIVFVQRTDSSGGFIQACYVLRDEAGKDCYLPNPLSMLPWELGDDEGLDDFFIKYLASEVPFSWIETMIQEGYKLEIDRITKYD